MPICQENNLVEGFVQLHFLERFSDSFILSSG